MLNEVVINFQVQLSNLKKIVEALIKEEAKQNLKLKELEERFDFRKKCRDEQFIPPEGESLD